MPPAIQNDRYVMGLFRDEERAVEAVKALADSPWRLERVHSPIPSHKISEAMGLKTSRVGLFTLAGGITGFCFGIGLAVFTATRWDIIVSGKPIVAWPSFFIIGFEFTILFAVFGNVIGLLTQMRLPRLTPARHYDPRCSANHFGLLTECRDGNLEGLKEFFTEKGGEVRIFETTNPPPADGDDLKEGGPQ